jgi:glycosyltransferase involved in cell wall biosynthesis
VIAADGGGARETVIDGETGIFFPMGDVAALSRAMRDQRLAQMRPSVAVASAKRFSVDAFKAGMSEQIAAAREAHVG